MIAAFVGPLTFWVSWAVWPHGMLPDLLDHLLFLIWPMRILGAIEYNSGALIANFVAIGANVVVFGLLGLMVGLARRWTIVSVAIFLLVAGLICLEEAWISGFDFAYVNPVVLIFALGFYASVFRLAVRLASQGDRSRAESCAGSVS